VTLSVAINPHPTCRALNIGDHWIAEPRSRGRTLGALSSVNPISPRLLPSERMVALSLADAVTPTSTFEVTPCSLTTVGRVSSTRHEPRLEAQGCPSSVNMKLSLASRLMWTVSCFPIRTALGAARSWSGQAALKADDSMVHDSTTHSSGTLILGAGVIGLSTAFHLASALQDANSSSRTTQASPIVVVESSKDVCPAASGQSCGGLGDFGFGPETAALGVLSYRLHQLWADSFNGRKEYDYTPLDILRVAPQDFTGTPSPRNSWGPAPPTEKPLSALPEWIKPGKNWSVELLADGSHAAHM
jgi:FAD dependent oxidoreductase